MPSAARTDALLPITDVYMQQIVRGEKNYEFRKYRMTHTVERIWFYITAPSSSIVYVCEIDPAVTREEGDPKLPEDGLGNKEYNTFHEDWKGYDFAYRVHSVYKILEPITLAKMKSRYGYKGAPRGLSYLPEDIANDVPWKSQECIIAREDRVGDKRTVPVDDGDEDSEAEIKSRPQKKARDLSSPKATT
ncbi:hypothetical protein C8J56DRAFT_829673 [Mycena floridula]|nr:hypothetical protein C8J56DRAFT_829673 [Mycena floridula]